MARIDYYRTPVIETAGYASNTAERLRRLWETSPGIYGWLATVDHKTIGIRYIVTAFVFLAMGGIEALILRLQLARPNEHLLTPEQYDQLFTMHGITMILWYAFPILTGFSVYLQPLLIGTRDMALPRLNALTFWVFLFSGLFLYVGLLIGKAPNAGWFDYVPYANHEFNAGPNIDFYALANILLGISTTLGSINFIVTFLRLRAPGMSLNRLPIMSWGTLTTSFANVLAVPAVSLAFFLLWTDRHFGTHFYDAPAGGHPLLMAASLLDVGASLGLRHRSSRAQHGVASASRAVPASTHRLHGGCPRDRADHCSRLWRVAAPYVRDRLARAVAIILQRGVDHHRHPERDIHFLMARHHLHGAARVLAHHSYSSLASSSCSSSAASQDS